MTGAALPTTLAVAIDLLAQHIGIGRGHEMTGAAPEIEFATGESIFCSVSGVWIHARVFEQGDSAKPNLLFIHGMWAHSHWWDHIIPYFRGDFRTAAMDLAGMGNSARRARYSIRGFAEDIVAIVQAAGLEPCTIVAHSFGGTPAIVASHLSPASIARVVIVDSRLHLRGLASVRSDILVQTPVTPRPFASKQQAIDRYRLIPAGDLVNPVLLKHVAETALRPVDGGWIWKFDPALDPQMKDDPDRFIPPGITTPMDFVYGEYSEAVDSLLVSQVAAYFPNCGRPVCIPQMHHHFVLEHPIVFIAALRSLLSRPVTEAVPMP
jgi:pimeloyl-ACP methyl ester carboxylesterase